jgi:orotate phosphoribosyltransferase-like protein
MISLISLVSFCLFGVDVKVEWEYLGNFDRRLKQKSQLGGWLS